MSDRRRTFNGSERAALFLASDGRCCICGIDLQPGWHADHVVPFAAGGLTDVSNGQALCPTCNLRKGSAMSYKSELRVWQAGCLDVYTSRQHSDFLLVAQPGAGKTRFAIEAMNRQWLAGNIQKVIVAVPTRHLKKQWSQEAARFGYDLDHGWANEVGAWPRDQHGLAVTYQQIMNQPGLFRKHAEGAGVVLDEVHHCSEREKWGIAIEEAFGSAHSRLLMSGTPFRTDGKRINFLTYRDGKAVPDYEYGYDDAIRDGVCRPVYFPRMGGSVEWVDDGVIKSSSFDEDLDERGASQRLRTALWPAGEWIPHVLREAEARINEVRRESPDAGGIVFCMDQEHAHAIADLLAKISGVAPVVAVSDDPDSDEKIARFRESQDKWIVSVRKVSEGVDIKRLRVGVFATNVVSEVFFRQAVGRVVRVQDPDAAESAWFYIPDDARLRGHAETLKRMRAAAIEEIPCDAPLADRAVDRASVSTYQPVASSAESVGVIVDGMTFTAQELAEANSAKMRRPELARFSDEEVAIIFREAREERPAVCAPPQGRPENASKTLTERKDELRVAGNKKLQEFAARNGLPYKDVNVAANKAIGVRTIRHADEEQLKRRLELAHRWLKNGQIS